MNAPNPFDLTGKVALVTGSTMGIGEGIARVLARAGAHVIISSRKAEDCARVASEFGREGLKAEPRPCHIGKMEDISDMAAHCRDKHGGLDLSGRHTKSQPAQVNATFNPKQDVMKIIYTSGTTGNSKGAMETHYNLVHNTITHAQILPPKPINFTFLPMNHTGGYMAFQLPTFHRGGTVIPRPMFDVEDAFEAIQAHKVNTLFGPPTFYTALLSHPKFSQYDLSSLTRVSSGAAPVSDALMTAWKEKTGTTLSAGWGGTETNTMGTWSRLKNKEKLLSDGVPFIGEIKIVDEKGEVVPRGKAGELLFRGLQVSKGYFNKPEETKAAFQQDGWFRSGDAGYIDNDDFLHYVDRIKDLIIASGYNIAPAEVEATILQQPSVKEAAVVGWPDDYRGETVKAFVVIADEYKGKVTEQEIIDFCRTKIASFKVPTIVEFIDALPRNMMGKALRRVLRDRAKQN
jgi:long-chain acyl-CoA synthetase